MRKLPWVEKQIQKELGENMVNIVISIQISYCGEHGQDWDFNSNLDWGKYGLSHVTSKRVKRRSKLGI